MTLLPLLFWTMLLLPGYSVARRFFPEELEGGLLPGIAVSWMSGFAVLAPLVAIGYLVEAPMAVAMVLLAGFIGWGFIDVLRSGAWRGVHCWRGVGCRGPGAPFRVCSAATLMWPVLVVGAQVAIRRGDHGQARG